jgi:endogenous inhibitor of DNA gyrase (YacG/DUF329 family)
MREADPTVLCPICHASITVDPEWRLVQCPRCGGMVTRMSEDSSYD